MSTIKVNKIEKRSGSTLTLGGPGTAVTLACGATQSGFGRTGTVDWQTGSIKTSTFTAANGEGYFANTSGGAFTMNLPAGSAGAIVSVVDYTNTFQTNNLTVAANGSEKIGGIAASASLSTQGQSATWVYVDATEGWKNVQDSTSDVTGNPYLQATGGTITTCGNYKIHTFTGSSTFTVSATASCSANNAVSYSVVAGGGGGGGDHGGGGGAGGFREGTTAPVVPYTASPLVAPAGITVTATGYPITIGAGGAGGFGQVPGSPNYPQGSKGTSGSNSVFSTITSAGGGGGAKEPSSPSPGPNDGQGLSGGSGGGGSYTSSGKPLAGKAGVGNTPPVSPAQGTNGGAGPIGTPSPSNAASGGGGATVAGTGLVPDAAGGAGGAGATTHISGSPVAYAGGGGGAGGSGGNAGAGGTGGGGAGGGGPGVSTDGTAGTANRGGGGGGAYPDPQAGGAGGSGIVILRYRFQ